MDLYEVRAHAKINLGLDITGVREDGYHLLRTVMQNISLADRLELSPVRSGQIIIETTNRFLSTGPKNIAYKTARLVLDEYGIKEGVLIKIDKKIPIAAGLAGGSADAAATLIALNMMFRLNMSPERMCELGVALGADVPFCIIGRTALAEGIGEKLTLLPEMPECRIVLVKPSFGLSTKTVYQAFDSCTLREHPNIDLVTEGLKNGDLTQICRNMGNVLEQVSFAEHPELNEIREKLLEGGALGARLSGSGPTVFGIFDDKEKAKQVYRDFKLSQYGSGTFLTEPFCEPA